jgi:urease accessory protein
MIGAEWTFWQLADSAFPSGGFAHSAGLESASQQGLVTDARSLGWFLESMLQDSSRSIVPFLVAVHSSQQTLARVDEWCDAFLSNHVANRGSRVQGRSFLTAAEAAFEIAGIGELRERVAAGELAGHHAPLVGRVTSLLALPLRRTVAWYLYTQLRDVISAATRLNIIGPLAGQALISRFGRFVQHEVDGAIKRPVDEVASTSPLLELVATRHDQLYSRLFQS